MAGWRLYGEYNSIKSQAVEKAKSEVADFITKSASGMVRPEDFLSKDQALRDRVFGSFWAKIQSPEIVRIKVWDRDFTVIYSNLPDIIGRHFPDNHEAAEALEGKVELEYAQTKYGSKTEGFSERQFLDLDEIYVPIRDAKGEVAGAIEIYQASVNAEVARKFKSRALYVSALTPLAYLIAAAALRYVLKPRNQ